MTARVILERDVPCALRDGTVLMADVYRPDDDDRHPVLLQRTPYDKTFFPFTWAPLDPTKMAQAGYAVVIQDVRGRFASGGEFVGPYVAEPDDGYDAVEWAARMPWSDGSVGMYGISYMAATQWHAALSRPPALRAIAPITSYNDYVEHHAVRGGAFQLGLFAAWTLVSVGPNALVRKLGFTPELLAELPALVDDIDGLDDWMRALPLVPFPPIDKRGGGFGPWFADVASMERRTPRHDDLSIAPHHGRITVPALQIAGWYDLLVQPDLDHFASMRAEAATEEARALTRLIVGPWAHGAFANMVGELDFGLRASGILLDLREDLTALHRRWFDARLRGIRTGIDDEPPVKIFVMGRNRWRSEDEWPIRRAKPERWHVHASGALTPRPPEASEPSVFTLDPDDPVPSHGGNYLMSLKYIRGPREQSPTERRPDVLVFTSEPLDREMEVTGRARFVCWVAADTVDSDVVARLCDVWPDGRSYNVMDGILRLRFRNGLDDPTPLTPGEVVRAEVDLWSTSHVFLAGHRIRLQVCASDFPRYDRCPGSGESSAVAKRVLPQRNLLFHDPECPTHVELPVVGS